MPRALGDAPLERAKDAGGRGGGGGGGGGGGARLGQGAAAAQRVQLGAAEHRLCTLLCMHSQDVFLVDAFVCGGCHAGARTIPPSAAGAFAAAPPVLSCCLCGASSPVWTKYKVCCESVVCYVWGGRGGQKKSVHRRRRQERGITVSGQCELPCLRPWGGCFKQPAHHVPLPATSRPFSGARAPLCLRRSPRCDPSRRALRDPKESPTDAAVGNATPPLRAM